MVLHTADLYWSYPGQRIFSVSANDKPVLTDYDVIAEAGEQALVDISVRQSGALHTAVSTLVPSHL